MISHLATIHALALVGDVTIGAGTRVWQFASVIRGAVLGTDCGVAGCAIIDAAKVGDRCCIGHGAQLHPGARLGNDVFVGPGAILCNDRWPRTTKDGFDMNSILSGAFITVEIGDGASIGAGAIVLPGVTIGEDAMIAAGAVVDVDVPACHIFCRDRRIMPIDPAHAPRRMCAAA